MTQAPGDDPTEMLIDYNERFGSADPTMFRDQLIAQMISVLIGKNKPNPLLIGMAGVGKTRLAEELARMIVIDHPLIPTQLKDHTVYELPLSNLVAGAGIVGALEERLAGLVDFAADPDNKAIIFIDEIHLIQNSNDPTYKKVSQILKPALARGDMRVIGATTLQESRSFDSDPAFGRRFSRLIVDELTREQTIEVLKSARPGYLKHYRHQLSVSDAVLEKCAVIADENSRADMHRPDNALTLLDRTLADTLIGHKQALTNAQAAGNTAVVQALQSVTTLPLSEKKLYSVAIRLMTGLAEPEPFDEQRVRAALTMLKGQDGAAEDLLDELRRHDLSVFPRTKPIAWLKAGPSGVGKTQMAKIMAEELTGQPPIMLNMGEFHEEHHSSKLTGSPPGYVGSDSDKELPFDTLESNPYRVILLDEIEKAHHKVHRLFLTALDEGWMRMADGKVIDFSKVIIIATTNAASDQLTKPAIGFSAAAPDAQPSRSEVTRALKEHFDPEFLGRFSQLVVFRPLDAQVYGEVLESSYDRERERIMIESPRMGNKLPAQLDSDDLDTLVAQTFVPALGARPAESAARRYIEDTLLAAQSAALPVTHTAGAIAGTGAADPADSSAASEDDSDQDADSAATVDEQP